MSDQAKFAEQRGSDETGHSRTSDGSDTLTLMEMTRPVSLNRRAGLVSMLLNRAVRVDTIDEEDEFKELPPLLLSR